jgi:predicted DNA-binding ribbon-helix-helix protein
MRHKFPAAERGIKVSALVNAIDAEREHASLSSAIRLFMLNSYRDQISQHAPHKKGA